MNDDTFLSPAQLASLDLLITIAQQRGRGLDDLVVSMEEETEGVGAAHEAMWEARHGGFEISEHDRQILGQIRELAAGLEMAPTLGQLIELRAQAVRRQG